MKSVMLLILLVAGQDTLAPRLPTLKLGKFVIYGLDTLQLHRETVEAYPRVAYTPEPGVPSLPPAFFAPPKALTVLPSLPRFVPPSAPSLRSEGYVLPGFGGFTAGLALQSQQPGGSASAWGAVSQWTSEAFPSQGPWVSGGVHLQKGLQKVEFHGRHLPQGTATWGTLRAELQTTPGPWTLTWAPWITIHRRQTGEEGVVSKDTTEILLSATVGASAGVQYAINASTKAHLRLQGSREMGDSFTTTTLEATTGLTAWRSAGLWTLLAGVVHLPSGLWRPVGHVGFLRLGPARTWGIQLYGQTVFPNSEPPNPLHMAALFSPSLPSLDPEFLLDHSLQPYETSTWITSQHFPPGWRGGLRLHHHRKRGPTTLLIRLGLERIENLPVGLFSSFSGVSEYLEMGGTWAHSRWTLWWAGVFRTNPLLSWGWTRLSYAVTPSTQGVIQFRKAQIFTVDVWLRQKVYGAFWAAAGVWNLTDQLQDLTRGRRLFLGLWWQLPINQGGVP